MRCHVADHVKKMNKSACSTSSTIIFPLSTNYIIVSSRCCCCCRCLIKHCLISTVTQHNILPIAKDPLHFRIVTKIPHEYIRVTYEYTRVTCEYIRVTYEYIRVHRNNIQVTNEYIRVTYEYTRLNMQVTYEYVGYIQMHRSNKHEMYHFSLYNSFLHVRGCCIHTRTCKTHAYHAHTTHQD